ncbi:MAG: transcription/translation regulatory transformer protein RfaH [Wenzhouxiangellaceae bacterium]|nr:transcription/translation regulatory transformer protein RfaH [Wenzhouxiangellaceae bacterium]
MVQGVSKAGSGAWFVVYCKPREESRATAHLENQRFDVLFPQVRLRRRLRGRYRRVIEPMFPRYLFVRLRPEDNQAAIRSTRGVIGLVRFGDRTPTVPQPVIDHILERSDVHGCVDLDVESTFNPGEAVQVAEGPFSGYQAVFEQRTGDGRVAVLMEIMQRERRVELPEHALVRQAR